MKLLQSLLAFLLCAWLGLAVAAPLDVNTATAAEFATVMKGVGPKKAEAIVAYREQHGPFKSVDELEKVPGIGAKTVEANRELLTVGTPAPAAAPPVAAPPVAASTPPAPPAPPAPAAPPAKKP